MDEVSGDSRRETTRARPARAWGTAGQSRLKGWNKVHERVLCFWRLERCRTSLFGFAGARSRTRTSPE